MEPLGSTAAVVQLLATTIQAIACLIELMRATHNVPEKLRRQKLTLNSLETKLLSLQPILSALEIKAIIPLFVLQQFQTSLLEVQKDVGYISKCFAPYLSAKKETLILRRRFWFVIRHSGALARASENLHTSEANLSRINDHIHFLVSCQTVLQPAKNGQPPDLKFSASPTFTVWRSRYSLLKAGSVWRHLGLHACLVNQQTTPTDTYISVAVGICFSLWLVCFSIYMEIVLVNSLQHNTWMPQLQIRLQHRVSIESPLMKASRQGNVPLIKQILRYEHVSVNDRTICSGKTALMIAIEERQFGAVECLLEHRADATISDDDQVTPLFAVAGTNPGKYNYFEHLPPSWSRWLDIFRLLVQYGADLHETVRGRHIASLNIVKDGLQPKTLEFLGLLTAKESLLLDMMPRCQRWSAIRNALCSGPDTVPALKVLHSRGFDLSETMDSGRTALHLAAEHCSNAEPLEYLYSIGCRGHINVQDRWGWTPLHYAMIARNSALGSEPFSKAVSLVRNDANPNLRGGKNPLNHYPQPEGEFTPDGLLRHARPLRFDQLVHVFRGSGIGVDVLFDDIIYDTQEAIYT